MNWTKRLVLAFLGLAALGGAALALAPRAVPVETGKAQRGGLQVLVEASGKTRVRDRYIISAPVSGHLARLERKAGDTLNEGEVVAKIAPFAPVLLDARTRAEADARVALATASRSEAEALVDRARVARDQAEHELQRIRKLVEANAIAPDALDSAQFAARARAKELTSAEASLVSARRGIEAAQAALARGGPAGQKRSADALVVTPAKGRVLRLLQESEGPVQAGAPLLEVGDPSALEIIAEFLTTEAVRIRPGTATLIDQYGAVNPLRGKVRLVEPSAFTKVSALGVEEQRVNVLIDPAAEGDWSSLGDYFQVQVRVVVWEAPSVVKVPLSALFRKGGAWNAFVVANGRSSLRSLQIGQRSTSEAEVLEGVSEGETIIVHPSDKLESGVRVLSR